MKTKTFISYAVFLFLLLGAAGCEKKAPKKKAAPLAHANA